MPQPLMGDSDQVTIGCHGSSATVHKLGATITSWRVDGEEKLFVSSKAIWDGSKPIRGGIPIVFPQFGTGPILPGQHGFARNNVWTVEKTGPDTAVCTLSENSSTLAVWPHKFRLTYLISIAEKELTVSLKVENPIVTSQPFRFTCLLHTYFLVKDISSAQVKGFSGLQYRDKLLDGAEASEAHSLVEINGEVDRTYLGTPNAVELASAAGCVRLSKRNLPDIVLWNPWIEKARAMADFGDEEYKRMLCIEAGAVAHPIELAPGGTWHAEQTLQVHQ